MAAGKAAIGLVGVGAMGAPMAGGTDAQIQPVIPVLDVLGNVIRTGKAGSGHAMKALNNLVSSAGFLCTKTMSIRQPQTCAAICGLLPVRRWGRERTIRRPVPAIGEIYRNP